MKKRKFIRLHLLIQIAYHRIYLVIDMIRSDPRMVDQDRKEIEAAQRKYEEYKKSRKDGRKQK